MGFSISHYIEGSLFVIIIILIVIIAYLVGLPPHMEFWEGAMEERAKQRFGDKFVLASMFEIVEEGIRFDFLLACLVLLVWSRLLMYFRGYRQFGPMFRMIQAMIQDLVQFMTIWLLV